MAKAVELLRRAMVRNNSLACCGLDPDISKMPTSLTELCGPEEVKVSLFLREIIDLTGPHICAYKVQKAMFDRFHAGHKLLVDTVAYAHERYPDVPVFIDAKVGDIENTMAAYLGNVFDDVRADGLVVNPYMGDDVLRPFASIPDKAGIVLVKTSNPGANIVQDVLLQDGSPYWMYILKLVAQRWNEAANLIPVLSSTTDTDMTDVRKLIRDEMPILFAGFGAQGGTLKQFRQLLDSTGGGVFVNSSRGILYPYNPTEAKWRQSVEGAVIEFKETLNKERFGYAE